MDSCEATKIVFSRIQSLDPENVSKVMGFLFMQEPGEKDMIRLAYGTETVLSSLIKQAKTHLGLSSNTSSTPSTPSSPSPFTNTNNNPFPLSSPRIIIPNNNGFHPNNTTTNHSSPSSPWSVSGFSTHISPRPSSSLSYAAAVVNGNSFSPPATSSFPLLQPFYNNNNSDLNDEDQLLFLDEPDPIMSPSGRSDSILFPYGNSSGNWVDSSSHCGDNYHHQLHRRSCSVNDAFLGGGGSEDGFGWRPCMYFAKGYCKNGNTCKFLHGGGGGGGCGFADSSDTSASSMVGSPSKLDGLDELLRMKAIQQQRFGAASSQFSPFQYNKCLNFMNDSPRSAAAALMMGEEFHKFGRCRPERSDFAAMGFGGNANSSSRQIYLTFPADSTFKEEDVSNYFSKFGPVQDVRIPFQQKRMFGFVTFVYPETVKMILAKGNPHFVCDSRVLVKPYKEKGKVPDKKQQQHQWDRGEFSACLSPPGLDPREPYDLPIGSRMFFNTEEMMLRRKLEQAELQQAIELQGRRLMNLQLMGLKNHHHGHQFQPNLAPGIPIPAQPHSHSQPHLYINNSILLQSDGVNLETSEENNCISVAADSPTASVNKKQQAEQQEAKDASDNSNGNDSGIGKEKCSTPENDDLHESFEHILPDNLFASPTKSAGDHCSIFSTASAEADDSTSVTTTTSNNIPLLPATSTLNMASLKSCFFQMPRFSSGQEAIEM